MNDIPGVSTAYWWVGQVVDEANWQKSSLGKLHNPSDVKGDNFSYKVRIMGRHDPNKTVPDSQLFTASVLLPTTAGSGHAGSVQTPNIRQGAFVSGFYKDGKDGNEPVIAFILPNNSQTPLEQKDPNLGFTPRSGFTGLNGNKPVSTSDISNPNVTLSPTQSIDPNVSRQSTLDQYIDNQRLFYIPKTKACEGPNGPLKGIQKTIGDAISLTNFSRSGILGTATDLETLFINQLNQAKKQITTLTKVLIGSMRTHIINKINSQYNQVMANLEPQLTIQYNQEFETATDIFLCIFQKILRKLPSLVNEIFEQLINKFLNAPLCAAEEFIANIISNIFDEISDGIGGAIEFLGISNAVGSIFKGLSIFVGVLEFLTCEDQLNCEMVEEWSPFSGARYFLEDLNLKIDEDIENYANKIMNGGNAASCDTSPILCGPPRVVFSSSTGSGASGNAIVSPTGAILGVDLINNGSGYSSTPIVQIIDDCGNGSGANAIAIMNGDKVDKVVIIDSGVGYLPANNGTTGGNGTIFSTINDTIIYNDNGYSKYDCNTTISVSKGDELYLRNSVEAFVYDNQGDILQTIIGKGPKSPIVIQENGVFTTPECITAGDIKINNPSLSDGSYPAVLELEDLILTNKGIGYSNNDKIIISPSNGATAEVMFNESGQVKQLVLTNPGIGFTEAPSIYIQSETGFNAGILPQFRVKRIGDDKGINIPAGTPLIKIVDCVGVVDR
jgi:hypothetical protein